MPDRSIKIVPVNPSNPEGPAAFAPQYEGYAWDGDLVTWNNDTEAAHWPWPTDANYQPLDVKPGDLGYMTNNIPARQGSRPWYAVNLTSPTPPQRVYYYCRNHPNERSERGIIEVIAVPSA
jgi:hypothetical protein